MKRKEPNLIPEINSRLTTDLIKAGLTRKPIHYPNENPMLYGPSFPIFIHDNYCLIPWGKNYLLEGRAAMVTSTSEFPTDRTKFHFRKHSSVLFNHFTSGEILQEFMSTGSSISKSSLCQQLLKVPLCCLNSNQNWNIPQLSY